MLEYSNDLIPPDLENLMGRDYEDDYKYEEEDDTYSVCSFIIHSTLKNTKTLKYISKLKLKQACHISLNYVDRSKAVALTTSLWCSDKLKQEEAERYWEFLLDKNKSPWSQAFTKINLHSNKFDEYFCVTLHTDKKTSYQLLVNLLICLRMPFEVPNTIKLWNVLVERGFSEVDAMFFTSLFDINHVGKIKYRQLPAHYVFNRQLDYFSLTRCLPLLNKNNTFNLSETFAPCNSIWDSKNNHTEKLEKHMEVGKRKYKGHFIKLNRNKSRQYIRYEDCLDKGMNKYRVYLKEMEKENCVKPTKE